MDEAEYCHRLALMYRGKVIALGTPAELKKQLTSHHLLHLETSDLLDTMRALESVPGVRDVAVFGGGLHVTVDDPAAGDTRASATALAAKGIELQRLEHDPALDGRRLRGHDRSARSGRPHELPPHRARLLVKELLHIIRDPRSLAMALALPLMMLLLFGYALSLDVDHIPTLVYDQDGTPAEPRADPRSFRARATSRSSATWTTTTPSSAASTATRSCWAS